MQEPENYDSQSLALNSLNHKLTEKQKAAIRASTSLEVTKMVEKKSHMRGSFKDFKDNRISKLSHSIDIGLKQ
jgi:LPS O-antigen subunit length determinant protein (WzzB/FepE family)